jgi:hypothetical protein
MKMGEAAGMADKHISTMKACYFGENKVQKLSADQSWTINGRYNYDQFPGNKDHGKQASVMAIAIMFVAVEPGTTLRGGSSSGGGGPKGMGGLKGAGGGAPKGLPRAAAAGRF